MQPNLHLQYYLSEALFAASLIILMAGSLLAFIIRTKLNQTETIMTATLAIASAVGFVAWLLSMGPPQH